MKKHIVHYFSTIGFILIITPSGEFIGSRQGLGYLIIYGSQVFQLDLVLMSIVILCLMAMGLYQTLQMLEAHYLRKMKSRQNHLRNT